MQFRLILVALALSVALPTSAAAAIIQWTVPITAQQALDSGEANPGATGSGSGTIILDTTAHTLSYDIIWAGTQGSEVFSHFHGAAAAGDTAPALYFLVSGNLKQGTIQLTDPVQLGTVYTVAQQEADLIAGLWYVNIHTTQSLQGEIRGQVPEPGVVLLLLGGAAVVGASRVRRRT